jgi:hypothetical protein
MNLSIPNPKKSVTVDLTVDQVTKAINECNSLKSMKNYNLNSKNDLMRTWKFHSLEFLSTGAYVMISVSSISPTQTKIDFEVSRLIGTFDQWYEVQKAEKHIENWINAISERVKTPATADELTAATIRNTPMKEKEKKAANKALNVIIGIVVIIVIIWIFV